VRRHLGYTDKENSYTQFLADKLTGKNFSSQLADTVTVIVFFTSLALSIWINFRDWNKKRKRNKNFYSQS
jgi:uncharacterized PurR-regulated membrane protein YhhQ (DUF165 family)